MTPIPSPIGIASEVPPAPLTPTSASRFVQQQNARGAKQREVSDRAHAARLREVEAQTQAARGPVPSRRRRSAPNVFDVYRERNAPSGGNAA